MKRINNLFDKIISIENLNLADDIAQRGKLKQRGVIRHNNRREEDIALLHAMLKEGKFKTSNYKQFFIYEPKEREISCLPYYPDRIVHHAIMNVLEPYFVSAFTKDTYSCIKERGIHAALDDLKDALRNVEQTQYCLKLDVRKFYPSIDHYILKKLLKGKFRDGRLLTLLFEIIDSAPGVPIGNYLSQYFANFYLNGFDHWLIREKKQRNCFRYADDIVILAPDKPTLHTLLADITHYLKHYLNLDVKDNYQVFPVAARGIDFVGYVVRHTHVRVRKSIKQNFARKLYTGAAAETIASYKGWLKHANARNLEKKLLYDYQKI